MTSSRAVTRRAALAAFLLFAAALLVVGPAEASRTTTDASSSLTPPPSPSLELSPLELAEPIDAAPRFGFGEDLGLLDPERGPGGFVLFARGTSRCELTYARNNPLRFVDPDGRQSAEAWTMYRERQEIEKNLGPEAVATYDRAFQQAGFTALTALSYVTPGPEELLTTPLFLGAMRVSAGARVARLVSKMDTDWAIKGFHMKIDGVEVALRPGAGGNVVLKPVFSSTDGKAFQAAAAKVSGALKDRKEVERLLREAQRGRDYLRTLGTKQATEKAGELHFLTIALEKLLK